MTSKKLNSSQEDVLQSFHEYALANGLDVQRDIPVGEIFRFSVDAKDKSKSGWGIVFINQSASGKWFGVGFLGSWKDQGRTLRYVTGRRYSKEDQAYISERINEAKIKSEIELGKRHEDAKRRAQIIWSSSENSQSQYFIRKKISQPSDVKIMNSDHSEPLAVIPMYDEYEEMWGIQKISEDGTKRFLNGQKVTGLFFKIGSVRNKIYICEGVATGCSIYEASGEAVFCAFNAGNLLSVALIVGKKYPDADLVIAADNDQWTKENPGLTKGKKAAIEANGVMAFPTFKLLEAKPTDFNDLHVLEGIEEVRRQLCDSASRPSINVSEKQEREIIEEVWAAFKLRKVHEAGLFRGHDTIVKLVSDLDGEKRIEPISNEYFLGECIEHIDWYKEAKEGPLATKPSLTMAKVMLSKPCHSMPLLDAILRLPTVLKSGEIVSLPGYHESFGFYLNSEIGLKLPQMPDIPSQGQVDRAVELLSDQFLGDFPFVDKSDKAHLIAGC